MLRRVTRRIAKKAKAHGKTLFWLFACLLFTVTSSYIYFVNAAVRNGVRWERADRQIVSLGATVAGLESRYLSLKQSITLSLAYENGFQDVTAVHFVPARTAGTVARANNEL